MPAFQRLLRKKTNKKTQEASQIRARIAPWTAKDRVTADRLLSINKRQAYQTTSS